MAIINRKKNKRILASVLVIIVCMTMLLSCTSYTDGAATVGYSFVQALVEKNYDAAYDLSYSLTTDVSTRQEFIDRFTNIYDALEISNITLLSRNVEQISEQEYVLNYSLQMDSGLLGTVTYDYTADIVSGPLGYSVIYTPALILPMLEEGDKVRVNTQTGERGEIFSADGNLLAQNGYAQSVYLDMEKDPDIEIVKSTLNSLLSADVAEIQEQYDKAVLNEYPAIVLLTYPQGTLTNDEIAQISAVEGMGVDESRMTPVRYYPYADNTAHVVGYLTSPSEEQLQEWADAGITENSKVGFAGIEAAFEEEMRSSDGSIVYIEDSRGEQKEILYEDSVQNGADVYLTIDTQMQNTAYTLLASNCSEEQSGAVVVMDYTNGDVLAMVSYPSFDPNLFNPITQEVWDYYNAEENLQPLYHRATQAAYMPGSTFKVFTAVPAIESGILTEYSSPSLTISNDEWIPSDDGITWNYPRITRVSTPAAFDFENAMKSSDNIFFAYYALQVGQDDMISYLDEIGIGGAPNFELPIALSSYKSDTTELNAHWLAATGYGMGELQITPIHLASMYTALMNDGDILNPTIVKKVSQTVDDAETIIYENSKTVFKEDVMQSSTIAMEKIALRRVIADGTAYAANLRDVETLIAKTGTAPLGDSRSINWVIAVDESPENPLIYLVVIDTGTEPGDEPKLAVLNGLVDADNYSNALMQNPFGLTDEDLQAQDTPAE